MSNFPVFDPITLQHIGDKPRDIVHAEGHWHRSIQANLIRKNKKNGFDIYVQKRSKCVDLSCHKIDQSLATQMICEDCFDEVGALKRGLKTELNISSYDKCVKLGMNLRIMKRYAECAGAFNREILSLFLVHTDEEPDPSDCPRVDCGYWLGWKQFLKEIRFRPNDYTKTLQMYMLMPELSSYITCSSKCFLNNDEIPEFNHKKCIIAGKFFSDNPDFKVVLNNQQLKQYICCEE